jgi:hypothetical protein
VTFGNAQHCHVSDLFVHQFDRDHAHDKIPQEETVGIRFEPEAKYNAVARITQHSEDSRKLGRLYVNEGNGNTIDGIGRERDSEGAPTDEDWTRGDIVESRAEDGQPRLYAYAGDGNWHQISST